MKYIIMCGGQYEHMKTPKHLLKVNGEVLVERTIRLLRENGIEDIAVSTTNPAFDYLDVPILKHENNYKHGKKIEGWWMDAFYPSEEPVCYIFGDVYFSDKAIKKIIETKTNDIEFFASKEPFSIDYPKKWREPFAMKVVNQKHLRESIEKTKELAKAGKTWRKSPLVWELWLVIKDKPQQTKEHGYLADFVVINDYTSDIDDEKDVDILEKYLKGGVKMIKVEVIENFTLGRFNELKEIERVSRNTPGQLYKGDRFVCEKDLADYLLGQNSLGRSFVKVIEIIPEKVIEVIPEKEEYKEEIKPDVQIKAEPKKTISKPRKKKNK